MIEENKNIDNFFVDRLAQNQVEEDWNTPSDDIWLGAKPHFEKEEKPRRRFIFWIFGTLIFGAIVIGAVVFGIGQFGFYSPKSHEEPLKIATTTIRKVTEIAKDPIAVESSVNKAIISEMDSKSEINSSSISEALEAKFMNNRSQSSRENLKQNVLEISDRIKKRKGSDLKEISNNRLPNSNVNLLVNENEAPKINQKTIVLSEIATSSTSSSSSGSIKPKRRDIILIEHLSNVENELQSNEASKSTGKLLLMPMVLLKNQPQQEVGLSHSKYLFEFFLQEELYTDEEGVIDINSSVWSVNASHRKWFSNRFSYTYGANFTSLFVDLDLDVVDTLDSNISQFVSDKYSLSPRNATDPEDFQIELLDGFELMKGDVINMKGNLDLSIRSVQIPILVDYHFYNNKMEYLLGAGASFDVLFVKQAAANISIFKDQQQVNKPFVNDASSGVFLDYSLLANFGAKYHLNKKWNIGLSTKLSIVGPLFSYAEIGVNYRWYR